VRHYFLLNKISYRLTEQLMLSVKVLSHGGKLAT
jgi:hypothetical protein